MKIAATAMNEIIVSPCPVSGCERRVRIKGLCRFHWTRKYHGTPLDAPFRLDPVGRFWAKVDKRGADECWPWKGQIAWGGYGHFKTGGKTVKAHRFAWEIANGPIPDGAILMHKCDVRACCNPGHLQPATLLENMRDCRSKGRRSHMYGSGGLLPDLTADQVLEVRARKGARTLKEIADEFGVPIRTVQAALAGRTYNGKGVAGEDNAGSKLTDAAVIEIRAAEGTRGIISRLSREFGVSPSAISAVRNRKSWTHVR